MAVTVEGPKSGEFRWVVTSDPAPSRAATLDEDLTEAHRIINDDPAQLWIREVDLQPAGPNETPLDEIAVRHRFEPYRDLWQLRVPLPIAESSISTRPMTMADLDDLVSVNNRAFSWHPEQSGLTTTAVLKTLGEPGHHLDGIRIHEQDGQIVGFCWTKIHSADELGEIYVIALDPSVHGQGLGGPMTQAGLDWLAEQGLETAMLYVESDNDRANATYARLGFTRHHIDRAYSHQSVPIS